MTIRGRDIRCGGEHGFGVGRHRVLLWERFRCRNRARDRCAITDKEERYYTDDKHSNTRHHNRGVHAIDESNAAHITELPDERRGKAGKAVPILDHAPTETRPTADEVNHPLHGGRIRGICPRRHNIRGGAEVRTVDAVCQRTKQCNAKGGANLAHRAIDRARHAASVALHAIEHRRGHRGKDQRVTGTEHEKRRKQIDIACARRGPQEEQRAHARNNHANRDQQPCADACHEHARQWRTRHHHQHQRQE